MGFFASQLYCKNKQISTTYSIGLGLVFYSAFYLYFLFYNNDLLPFFNNILIYVVSVDLLLTAFYSYKVDDDTEHFEEPESNELQDSHEEAQEELTNELLWEIMELPQEIQGELQENIEEILDDVSDIVEMETEEIIDDVSENTQEIIDDVSENTQEIIDDSLSTIYQEFED